MPSRKYSVNSHTSLSSHKTSGSSIVETFCHRAASVHQINELYAALSELIHSSPLDRYGNTRDSSAKRTPQWSSEDNLLGNGTELAPRSNSEGQNLRPARSASCLSSKSCYAAIGSSIVPATASSRNAMTSKTSGICSKIAAKFRGKKLREPSKFTDQQHVKGVGQEKSLDGVKVQTIDDLLEMAQLEVNANGKTNSKDKKAKAKAIGRTKANSFDSCEIGTTNICVHKVSSKLRTWYTRAASYAATIEDEDRSRAESSVTGSTENFLERSGNESRGGRVDDEERANEELIVRDFDASFNGALDESQFEDLEHKAEKRIPHGVEKLRRRAYTDLNSKGPSTLLEKSHSKSKSNDDSYENGDVTANAMLSQTLLKSEKRCDLIRRLSLDIVEDVLAGKSASCTQIGTIHLNRDLSKRKVQQWLKNLHSDEGRKSCLNFKEGDAVSSKNANDDGKAASDKNMQHSPTQTTLNKDASENHKGSDNSPRRHGLPAQALFYIPNIEQAEQSAPVNMILNF